MYSYLPRGQHHCPETTQPTTSPRGRPGCGRVRRARCCPTPRPGPCLGIRSRQGWAGGRAGAGQEGPCGRRRGSPRPPPSTRRLSGPRAHKDRRGCADGGRPPGRPGALPCHPGQVSAGGTVQTCPPIGSASTAWGEGGPPSEPWPPWPRRTILPSSLVCPISQMEKRRPREVKRPARVTQEVCPHRQAAPRPSWQAPSQAGLPRGPLSTLQPLQERQ